MGMISQGRELRRLLRGRLDQEELRSLACDLDVDYDDLRGEGKTAKIRDLVAYLQRRNRLGEIFAYLEENRPDLGPELGTIKELPVGAVGRGFAAGAGFWRGLFAILAVVLIVGTVAVFVTLRLMTPPGPAPTAVQTPSEPPPVTAIATSGAAPTASPVPTPAPTARPTPTPTLAPEPFDESYFGILVADFVRGATERKPFVEGADLAQTTYEDIVRRVERENMSSRVAVRRVGPVRSDDEAQRIGKQHGARLVVWGYVPVETGRDERCFVPCFTVLASSERLIAVDPVLFGVRVSGLETLELSRQLSARVTGVSAFVLSMVYLTEGEPGDYEQAVRMLDISIESTLEELGRIDEDDPRRDDLELTLSMFYATRGRAYAAVGDEASGYDDYRVALKYDPHSVRAYHGMGNYHFVRGELDAAYEAFDTARRLDPMLYRPYYGLAIVAYVRGDYREAEAQLKRAIELASARDIELLVAHFTLGLTYLQLGDSERAEIEFQRVVSSENVPQDLREAAGSYLTPTPPVTPTRVPALTMTAATTPPPTGKPKPSRPTMLPTTPLTMPPSTARPPTMPPTMPPPPTARPTMLPIGTPARPTVGPPTSTPT
jgi:tetratricopeptide (TPR) repeat protein